MRIKNGEKKWFKLKDKSLRKKAKGDDPQVLVEMNLHWNSLVFSFDLYTSCFFYSRIGASLQTFNPKQLKYEDKSDTKF